QNCLFTGNRAIRGGGLYSMAFAEPVIVNCTIAANFAAGDSFEPLGGGAMFHDVSASARFINGIAWFNTPNEIGGNPGAVSYSCVDTHGGPPVAGLGNIAMNPRFLGPACGPDGIPGTDDDPARAP